MQGTLSRPVLSSSDKREAEDIFIVLCASGFGNGARMRSALMFATLAASANFRTILYCIQDAVDVMVKGGQLFPSLSQSQTVGLSPTPSNPPPGGCAIVCDWQGEGSSLCFTLSCQRLKVLFIIFRGIPGSTDMERTVHSFLIKKENTLFCSLASIRECPTLSRKAGMSDFDAGSLAITSRI